MPLRQTIGISLALLMASAGAMAKTMEKSTSYHPASPANLEPERSENRPGKARAPHRVAHARATMRTAFRQTRPLSAASGTDQTDGSRPVLFVAAAQNGGPGRKLGHRRPWMPTLSRI